MNVHESLMAQLQARATFGQQKYGKALEPWNGRNPTIDAQEELLDLFVYLEQLRLEREAVVEELKELEETLLCMSEYIDSHLDEEAGSHVHLSIDADAAVGMARELLDRLSQDVPRIGYPAKEEEKP